MRWVINLLTKRLAEEEGLAFRHGQIAAADRKYAESARMARERIPQLTNAINILKSAGPMIVTPAPIKKREEANHQLKIF